MDIISIALSGLIAVCNIAIIVIIFKEVEKIGKINRRNQ